MGWTASWTDSLTVQWIHTEAGQNTSVQNNLLGSDEREKGLKILNSSHSSYSNSGDCFHAKTSPESINYWQK